MIRGTRRSASQRESRKGEKGSSRGASHPFGRKGETARPKERKEAATSHEQGEKGGRCVVHLLVRSRPSREEEENRQKKTFLTRPKKKKGVMPEGCPRLPGTEKKTDPGPSLQRRDGKREIRVVPEISGAGEGHSSLSQQKIRKGISAAGGGRDRRRGKKLLKSCSLSEP